MISAINVNVMMKTSVKVRNSVLACKEPNNVLKVPLVNLQWKTAIFVLLCHQVSVRYVKLDIKQPLKVSV